MLPLFTPVVAAPTSRAQQALPVENLRPSTLDSEVSSTSSCPISCSPGTVRITTQVDSSGAVEVSFCERSGSGIGELWVNNRSTIAHIVRFLPPSHRTDVTPKAIITWGPDYCFQLASDLTIRPGDRFGIQASRFGSTQSEHLAASNAHLSLMDEILFAGDTPPPDLSKADAIYRYGEVLCSAAGQVDACDMGLLLTTYRVLTEGKASDVVDLLLALADSDEGLNAATHTLLLMGKVVEKTALSLLLKTVSTIKDFGTNIISLARYVLDE